MFEKSWNRCMLAKKKMKMGGFWLFFQYYFIKKILEISSYVKKNTATATQKFLTDWRKFL